MQCNVTLEGYKTIKNSIGKMIIIVNLKTDCLSWETPQTRRHLFFSSNSISSIISTWKFSKSFTGITFSWILCSYDDYLFSFVSFILVGKVTVIFRLLTKCLCLFLPCFLFFARLSKQIFAVSSLFNIFNRGKIKEMWRTMNLMVEFFRVWQLKFVSHIRWMTYT